MVGRAGFTQDSFKTLTSEGSEGCAHIPSCVSTEEDPGRLSTHAPKDGVRPGLGIIRVIGRHLKSQVFLNSADDVIARLEIAQRAVQMFRVLGCQSHSEAL